uniref:Uncharacterized protein n=1 Tax=Stomoxys calcitrans TaxID=35570 RepID=A0A1I8Q569_STOCA|nr:unnamed protein product [Stomoxys calcitrans]
MGHMPNWLLFIIGFVTACLVFADVTREIGFINKHYPLKTVIADLHYPVFKIPFPEIIICNKNRLNWQRYNEAKQKFLQQRHWTPKHEQLFIDTLNAYDTLSFGKFDNFGNISNLYPPILLNELNYLNFSVVVKFMAWQCQEIFSECFWLNRPYDCCDIFSLRKSSKGFCLAFNSMETEEGKRRGKNDPYYPWRSWGRGSRHGLKLRIFPRIHQHSPGSVETKGIMMMLVEPYVWSYIGNEIGVNTRAMDELESMFYKSLINHRYMFENCQAECQQEYLLKFCNCTVDIFFPPDKYRACRLSDLPCLYKHNDFLQVFEQLGEHEYVTQHVKGMACPCFYNCKSLSYFTDIRQENLGNKAELEANETEIRLEVYFLWETIKLYETTAVYTLIDLMASLGGLASLCIGCSLVGVMELLYFLFLNVPKRIVLCSIAARRVKSIPKKMVKTKKVLFHKITPAMPLNKRRSA